MNADPLAQLLADAWMDAHCLPEVRDVMRPLIERESTLWAASLRAHRDEMLAALGGTELVGAFMVDHDTPRGSFTKRYMQPGESVWVFGEDA